MTARLTGRRIIPAVFLLTLSLCGCDKPSYPTGKVEDSLIKLCEDEYGLTDVKVKITGSTLGVYIPIEGLVDSNLKLDKDAGEKIEDVALSIHRVTTSTDMPLKFYTLTARDTRAIGAEFILTGFIYDVIRVRLLDISRGEYFRRILRDFRFNPAIMGEQKIKEFFDALKKDPALAERVKFLFYPIYAIGKKDTQDIIINGMDAKEVSEREALLYVRTIESYEVAPGFEAYLAIFPPGFNNEYLVLIDLSAAINPIKEIVSKYFYSNNEIRQRDLAGTFEQYKDVGYIGIDGFPKKDLDTGWFLSQQIARRIKTIFEEDPKLTDDFRVETSEGEISDKIFKFKFNAAAAAPSEENTEIIFSRIIKMAVATVHLYGFEDFIGMEFTDTSQGGGKIYLSRGDLENFRKNKKVRLF